MGDFGIFIFNYINLIINKKNNYYNFINKLYYYYYYFLKFIGKFINF